MQIKNLPVSATWKRRLWIVPPLVIGALAIVAAPMIKSKPAQVAPQERAVKVRAIKVTPLDVVARAVGYGTVKPARSWEAVAEVAGQVVWISDDLKNGRTVDKGAVMLRIEDVNYRLALAQASAQLHAAEAQVETTRANLAIAEQDLKILAADFKRKKDLAAKGAVAKTTVEASERQMLNGQTQVQTLQNTLLVSEAEREVLASQKASAELDLERTLKIAPFAARITEVKIGEAQYANKGQLLFTADGMDVAEIEAQFPIGMMRPLINAVQQGGQDLGPDPVQGVKALNAQVRLRTPTHTVEWAARIERAAGVIDPQTQSIGVVVAIDNPEAQAQPGLRPRLLRGTFVEVELSAPPLAKQVVVPRAAVHGATVYVVGDEDRLETRKVDVGFTQGTFAVLKGGVKPGERVVTSDLVSAIDGMLLAPQEDKKTKRALVVEVTGEEPQK